MTPKQCKKTKTKKIESVMTSGTKKPPEEASEEESSPIEVSHGVHHLKTVKFDKEIHLVIFNSNEMAFVTVQKGVITKFALSSGRLIESFEIDDDITKMIFIKKTGFYLAVIGNNLIQMMNSEFEVTATTHSTFDISCLYYNPINGNVISGGSGNISLWGFRFGGTYLVLLKTVTEEILESEVFDNMAIEIPEPDPGVIEQKCYAVSGTSVAVFEAQKGLLLDYKKSLHIKKITSVLYFCPMKYIITASRDGCIKVWTSDFEIRLVFVGHVRPVISLNAYPQGPYLMSASTDQTIRVWSLETEDEVDLIETGGDTIRGMTTNDGCDVLYTYSKTQVQLFQVTHLHQLFTSVGNPVKKIKKVSYEMFVDRMLCMCMDGTVHLVSPVNGVVLTSMIPPFITSDVGRRATAPPAHNLICDAEYYIPLEMMVATYSDGTLLRANTCLYPARIERQFKFQGGDIPKCLCIYEYIVDRNDLYDSWNQVRNKTTLENIQKQSKFGYKVLLLAGTVDGHLISINMDTGGIEYKVLAHGEGNEVISILSNAKQDQLITSGSDNVVKIWQMFPNSIEPGSLVTTFYCAHNATHMNMNEEKLMIGFQQATIATFTSVIYNLETKERFDHEPDEDHIDELTSITSTTKLNILASSSKDGTIHIWNEKNQLLRKLKLNAEPICMEFLNSQADIVVALNDRIHIIKSTSYLPKPLLNKLVCMEWRPQKKEGKFVIDDALLNSMTHAQRDKLSGAKSTYASHGMRSDLPEAERKRRELESREREHGFARIDARDNDLMLMRDGVFISNKPKSKRKTKIKERVLRKYMALFYDRPTKVPEAHGVDKFDPNPPKDLPPPLSPRGRYDDTQKAGFFPSVTKAKPLEEIPHGKFPALKHSGPDFSKQGFIINPTSFIPNSVLLRLLWPPEKEKEDKKKKTKDKKKIKFPDYGNEEEEEVEFKLPAFLTEVEVGTISQEFSKRKLVQIREMMMDEEKIKEQPVEYVVSEGDDMHERVLTLDLFDDEPPGGIVKPSAGRISPYSRFSQSSDEMRGLASPEDASSDEEFRRSEEKPSGLRAKMLQALKTPTPPPRTPTPPPPPTPPRKMKEPVKPNKPIVKHVTKPRVPRKQATPPPPDPHFLTQFDDQAWFGSRKEDILQRMEKPYQANDFFNLITQALASSIDWIERTTICMALMLLWQQENLQQRPRALLTVLNGILNAQVSPNSTVRVERSFLQICMKLYMIIYADTHESDLIIQLLTQYLEGDQQHQKFVMESLAQLGLEDPNGYLDNEFNNMETWNLEEDKPLKPQLKSMVLDWMNVWKARLEGHFSKTVDDLKRGKKLEGRVVRKLGEVPAQPITLNINQLSGNHKIKLIEVLNYFCEMAHENEMERERLAKLQNRKGNTVLVLPPIGKSMALKRLGEMHTARRYREKNNLAVEYRVPANRPYPDLDAPFTNKIKLNFALVSMSPLDCPDRFDESSDFYQPILITLRNPIHQRYFVHEKSYVHCN